VWYSFNRCTLFRFQCGTASIDVPKVTGGKDVQLHEIPWQAYLEIEYNNIPGLFHCGGVLVEADVVLTAAHCVKGVSFHDDKH
jgi:secreted trypsin-like serine protease